MSLEEYKKKMAARHPGSDQNIYAGQSEYMAAYNHHRQLQKKTVTPEQKAAQVNERNIKAGKPLELTDGKIYSFGNLSSADFQKSIDWANSEIEKLKQAGGKTNRLSELASRGLALTTLPVAGSDAYKQDVAIKNASDKIRELTAYKNTIQQYMNSAQLKEDIDRINSDEEAKSKLVGIFNIDNEQKLFFLNAGEDGYSPESYADRYFTRERLVNELKELGYEDTDRYIESFAKYRNKETIEPILSYISNSIVEHPLTAGTIATAANVITSPIRGAGILFDNIMEAAGIYGYSAATLPSDISDATVTSVSTAIDKNFDNPFLKGLLNTAYSAGVSISENMFNASLFGAGTEFVLGLGAGTAQYKTAKQSGLSEAQSIAYGIAAAAFESIFEHLSLGELRQFKSKPASTFQGFLINAIKGSLVEVGEELSTDIANEAYDYLINGGLSQYEQALQSGMTAEEYAKDFGKQLLETMATAALSGVGMTAAAHAPSYAAGRIDEAKQAREEGEKIRKDDKLLETLKAAEQAGGKASELADKVKSRLNYTVSDAKSVNDSGKLSVFKYNKDMKISDKSVGKVYRQTLRQQASEAVDRVLSEGEYNNLSKKERNEIRSSVLTFINSPDVISPEQADVLKSEKGSEILEATRKIMDEKAKETADKVNERHKAEEDRRQAMVSKNITEHIKDDNTSALVINTFDAKHSDGSDVKVGGIVGVKDGSLEVIRDAETGATEMLSEINITNNEEAQLYDTLNKRITSSDMRIPMTVEAANVALSLYDPLINSDSHMYALWAHDASIAATGGMSFEQFLESQNEGFKNYITAFQLEQIYNASLRNIHTQPGVTRMGGRTLTKMETEALFLLQHFGKKYGVHFLAVDGLTDGNGRNVNAMLTGKNVVIINLKGEGGLLTVGAGHELFHWLKRTDTDSASYLQNLVIQMMKNDNDIIFEDIYNQRATEYQELTEDEILEEIAAQYFGVVFSSEENIRKAVNEANDAEKSILKKIIGRLKQFIAHIKATLREYAVKDKTVEAALNAEIKDLEELARKFDAALTAAREKNKPTTDEGGVKFSRRLKDNDLSGYLNAGGRQNKNKVAALENGHKVILTSQEEITEYINSSVDKKHDGVTVAYGIVNSRLAEEVREISAGKINIKDYYLEFVPFDLQHAFEQHHIAKEKGDVDLSREDFEKIPEYFDNYDELLYARRYSSGNTRICVSKKISNGRMLIIETVSKSRGAMQFKNAIGVSEEKYYSDYKKESGENSRGNDSSNISLRDSTTFNSSVSHKAQTVNNNDMQKDKKDNTKYSRALSSETKEKVLNAYDIVNLNDSIEVQRKVFSALQKNGFFTDEARTRRIDVNEETGMEIETNKSGINETFSYKNFVVNSNETKIIKLATITSLPSIIKHGKLIDDNVKNIKKENSGVKYAYLVDTVIVDGNVYDVKITIRKSFEKNKFWVHHIYIKNDTAVASDVAQLSESSALQTNGVKDSVSQSDIDVKEKYSRQLNNTADNIEQLKAENESFSEYVDEVVQELQSKLKNKKQPDVVKIFDRKELYKIAAKYNTYYEPNKNGGFSKKQYSNTEIADIIENVLSEVSQGKTNVQDAVTRLTAIQENVLQNGYEIEYEPGAKEFRKELRNKPIYLTARDYNQLVEEFGGTRKALRAASYHQLSFKEAETAEGANISEIYNSLKERHPDFIGWAENDLEMARELISTERALRPKVHYASEALGFEGEIELEEAAVRRAIDILQEAFNVELVQTDFQRQYNELQKVRQSLNDVKRLNRNILENAVLRHREREERNILLKRITRNTKRLSDMLINQTDKRHIPEELKKTVTDFLLIINEYASKSGDTELKEKSLVIARLTNAYEEYSLEDTLHSDEHISDYLRELQTTLYGDRKLKELSISELGKVSEIITHINFLVNEGNKTFVDELRKGYEHSASISREELQAHKEERKIGFEKIKDAEFHMLQPWNFFKMVGTRFEGSSEITEELGKLGQGLFSGEEKTAKNFYKVKKDTQEIMQNHNYNSKWLNDKKEYVFSTGDKASLSTENVMNILALADREKANGHTTDHLFAGGFVVADSAFKSVSDYIKPIPETVKYRRELRTALKEKKKRLKSDKGKIVAGMSDIERAKVLKETALRVVDATEVFIEEDVVGQVEKLKTEFNGSAFKVVRELGEKFGVFKDYSNENIKLEFNYSVGSIKKSINEAEKNNENIDDFAKMLSVFDEVISNSQPIEVHTDKYKGTKKENTNLKQAYVLMSAFQDGNSIVPVEFVVKEYNERNKNQLYISVNLKRIEAGVSKAGKNNLRNTFRPASETEVSKTVEHKSPDAFRSTSIFRLADIISCVNPLDKSFLKYIPASMLNEAQNAGRVEGILDEKERIAKLERNDNYNDMVEEGKDETEKTAAKIAQALRVNISEVDIEMLRNSLTAEQTAYYKALVDEMTGEGARMGNETSMKMHGYNKYTEKSYCPFSVASDYILERYGIKRGETRIKNRSFTKSVAQNANAPVCIGNMTEVYIKHMRQMCEYNGMAIPLESIERLLNHKEADYYKNINGKLQLVKGQSYRELFREAFGDRALKYLENLLTDLNGGTRADNRGAVGKFVTNFKRSAVSASLTVALQQPSAVGRALFKINPQYFSVSGYMPGLSKKFGEKLPILNALDRYDEMLRYVPVAIIKDMGKFDTNVGKSFEDWALEISPDFALNKKSIDTWVPGFYKKLGDAMMWLPGYLDKSTWLHIWNAVKRETAVKYGVSKNKLTESQLKEAGKRCSEVFRETQVYDSTLARSDIMRSKNAMAQMATAFMAEPTVTYNMMRYAATTAKHQPKVFARTVTALLCSIVLNELLKNFARAIRYDDEESNFWEVMLSGGVTGLIDDINALTYIPYVKDIWSMLEGYDVERVDMSVFSKLIEAISPFITPGKETSVKDWEQLILALSMFTGIPANNLWKDVTGLFAKFKKGSPKFSVNSLKNNIISELSDNPFVQFTGKIIPPIYYFFDMSDEKIVYNAIINKDTDTLNRYLTPSDDTIKDYIKKGYSEEDAILKATDNAENNFHSKVVLGLISEDIRIREAADARLEADAAEYDSILEELCELGFDRNDVITAVNKYIASLDEPSYKKSEDSTVYQYTYDDLFNAIDKGNEASENAIYEYLRSNGAGQSSVQNKLKERYAEDVYNAVISKNEASYERYRKMFEEKYLYSIDKVLTYALEEYDNDIREAAESRYNLEFEEYQRIADSIIEKGFENTVVYGAIESAMNEFKPETPDKTYVAEPDYNYETEYADMHRAFEQNDLPKMKYVISELLDSGVKASSIKKSLSGRYRDKYKEAWLNKDELTCAKIREFLLQSGVGYNQSDFTKWERDAKEKQQEEANQ